MSDPSELFTPPAPEATIELEGERLRARAGEPLAVALFRAGVRVLGRSAKFHRPRGLFCLEGHCASCLMRIDGKPNRRACLVPAAEGSRCERQNAYPDADLDLLAAADWLFPQGMDHHRMMTGSRIGNRLFMKLVHQMGGSGILPDEDALPARLPEGRHEEVDVCVVGAGPAGLAAATALARARPSARVLVVDEQDEPGGSLLAEPDGLDRAREQAARARVAGAIVWSRATVIAHYPEDAPAVVPDGPQGLLAVVTPDGLVRVSARRLLYTTGAYDQNIPFAGNDRPGVISARACGRLAFRYGVRPGRKVVIVEEPAPRFAYADRLEQGLAGHGVATKRALVGAIPRVDLRRDVLAVAALPAPASELPRQHGAQVTMDEGRGGFAVEVDGAFRTTARGVWAAGDVAGFVGPDLAAQAGERAGRAVAEAL